MRAILCLLLAVSLVLPGVGFAGETVIAASFYPVYVLAQNVLADVPNVRVVSLAQNETGCLHDYQLLPGDMRALADASALLICGAGMEGYLDVLTAQFPDLPVIEGSAGIALLPGGEHGEGNAHVWLDPKNAIIMVENIATGLSALLPEHAAQISDNAKSYQARLAALDEELQAGLATLENRAIVTFHDAFPYFAEAYGLTVAAVVALEPGEALSPAMLAEVSRKVLAAGSPPLFTEPQYQDAAALAVAAETGAKVYALDPLVTGDGAPDAYETGMRRNMETLLLALGGQ